jgi:Mg-chelatase subunit ChlD
VGGGPPAGSQAANELHFGAEELARKGIDLIWTIDTSGSMRRPFAGIQRLLAQATTVLDGLFSDLRVGMVAYRDAVEASLPLADDPKRVLRALEQLVPGQGSGVPEGVDAGLRAALDARLMGWRKASAVAVVVVGDAGPPEPRATALLERVKGLRAEDRRLVVHAVQLEAALHYEAAVGPFWTRLAQAGGGALIRPQAEQEAIERLCLAIPAGIDREVFARVLRAIGKVEDWKLEVPGLSPLPDGGVAGGERDTFVPPKRAGGSP